MAISVVTEWECIAKGLTFNLGLQKDTDFQSGSDFDFQFDFQGDIKPNDPLYKRIYNSVKEDRVIRQSPTPPSNTSNAEHEFFYIVEADKEGLRDAYPILHILVYNKKLDMFQGSVCNALLRYEDGPYVSIYQHPTAGVLFFNIDTPEYPVFACGSYREHFPACDGFDSVMSVGAIIMLLRDDRIVYEIHK